VWARIYEHSRVLKEGVGAPTTFLHLGQRESWLLAPFCDIRRRRDVLRDGEHTQGTLESQ